MHYVPAPQCTAETTVMTSAFLDAAAALETSLQEAEARASQLQRDLRCVQQYAVWARRWIVTIRKCHRSQSHAATTRAIRQALTSLDSNQPTVFLF